MNSEPKNKILILIIGILLIANIVTLSFFMFKKNDHGKNNSSRNDKKAMVTSYLKKEVGFSNAQVAMYDTLSDRHRSKMKLIFDEMGTGREKIFKQLGSESFTDSAMEKAASAISTQQQAFELMMLYHLKDIRNLCTEAQKPIFDSGFYKIISKRGDNRKNKAINHSNQ